MFLFAVVSCDLHECELLHLEIILGELQCLVTFAVY